jgi:hypothetical protein
VVILQKADKAAREQQGGAEVGTEIPVPTSAFAALKGGESAKSTADLSPFSGLVAAKHDPGSDGESGSPDEVRCCWPSVLYRIIGGHTVLKRVLKGI